MNCDQVFEVLTQGPFPTGNPIDDRVERHIACCYECRQMAEALRPAVDLFHESISEMDQVQLPEYRGRFGASTLATLPEVVETLIERPRTHERVRFPSGQRSHTSFWRQRICVVAISLVVVTLVVVGIGTRSTSKSVPNPVAITPPTPSNDQLAQPAGMALTQLSAACFKNDAATVTPLGSTHDVSENIQCCTLCHNAANPSRPRIDSIAILEKSCSGCHSR
jgi:hypothetical protein